MIDYKIVTANSKTELEEKVKDFIQLDWLLLGGVSVQSGQNINDHYFAQAVIKEE